MYGDDYGTEMEAIEQERWDADLLQAQYEQEGRQLAADRRRGICHHGSQLGHRTPAFYGAADIAAMREQGDFPDRATDARVTGDQATIPAGMNLCLDCGTLVERTY